MADKRRGAGKDTKDAALPLRAALEGLGLFLAYFILLIPLMLIVLNSGKLGGWWLPLAIAYMLPLVAATAVLIRRKVLDHQHMIIGDEMFYELHPGELKRDQRKKARRKARLERIADRKNK